MNDTHEPGMKQQRSHGKWDRCQ